MILDLLENSARYASISPRLNRAFTYLRTCDLSTIEPGVYEIEGRDIYLTISQGVGRPSSEAPLEVHDSYLDIQLLLSGNESYGWSPRAELSLPQGPFDTSRDIQFFSDSPRLYYSLRPGEFTLFFPEDAHAPLIGEGEIRKAILKVRI